MGSPKGNFPYLIPKEAGSTSNAGFVFHLPVLCLMETHLSLMGETQNWVSGAVRYQRGRKWAGRTVQHDEERFYD